jgi:poly(3-hydroxybutyrate) depolymerase
LLCGLVMTVRFAILALLAATACREASSGALDDRDLETAPIAERAVTAPCAGCALAVPESPDPVPLLVVLHGDAETAAKWFERWRGPALARGWAVLALQCPEELGCPDARWYMWNGDPKWIADQVAAVAKQAPLDRGRIYLAGWSGGASYMSNFAASWAHEFAAVVVHGGGQETTAGCPARALPAYFLVGDENPDHASHERYRDYFTRCNQEVRWDVIDGANHALEDAALDPTKANTILDWLAEHGRNG